MAVSRHPFNQTVRNSANEILRDRAILKDQGRPPETKPEPARIVKTESSWPFPATDSAAIQPTFRDDVVQSVPNSALVAGAVPGRSN